MPQFDPTFVKNNKIIMLLFGIAPQHISSNNSVNRKCEKSNNLKITYCCLLEAININSRANSVMRGHGLSERIAAIVIARGVSSDVAGLGWDSFVGARSAAKRARRPRRWKVSSRSIPTLG